MLPDVADGVLVEHVVEFPALDAWPAVMFPEDSAKVFNVVAHIGMAAGSAATGKSASAKDLSDESSELDTRSSWSSPSSSSSGDNGWKPKGPNRPPGGSGSKAGLCWTARERVVRRWTGPARTLVGQAKGAQTEAFKGGGALFGSPFPY